MLYFIFYQVFSEDQLWLVAVFFKLAVFVDLIPNVIAIGVMIATRVGQTVVWARQEISVWIFSRQDFFV